MFKKILIANRGEIVVRIARTARQLGIHTVGIFSEADEYAEHLKHCDSVYCIGKASSSESYLNIKKIVNLAKEEGVDAVHPGYGFLSENPGFAQALSSENITFIGPSADVISLMGDKITSKIAARKAGVNCIPGSEEEIKNIEQANNAANNIGYPVMIKASAGGGGKGMRVVTSDDELHKGFIEAKSEAKNSFADDRIFLEKYIQNPRHIEIQILADSYGNTIWLGERECSIQRRNQKVVEEAPSTITNREKIKEMGEQSVKLAKAVKYKSAGTVEFVVDEKENFYFLEMNTRLQVEHPVTEYVTGLDLVEEMINIADGNKLKLNQESVNITGWAIECRIYAEDPLRDFLPSTGRVNKLETPKNNNVRIDSGISEGSEVSIYYDPMLAKLITKGKNREEAIKYMRAALDQYVLKGPANNISFLTSIISHPRFIAAEINTNFIKEEYPEGYKGILTDTKLERKIAGLMVVRNLMNLKNIDLGSRTLPNDWCVIINNKYIYVSFKELNQTMYSLLIEDEKFMFEVKRKQCSDLVFSKINGEVFNIKLQEYNNIYLVDYAGFIIKAEVYSKTTSDLLKILPEKDNKNFSKKVLSPMPGRVVSIDVSKGDVVQEGQSLLILDAMKMENRLLAEISGSIKGVHVNQDDSVTVDQLLVEFD